MDCMQNRCLLKKVKSLKYSKFILILKMMFNVFLLTRYNLSFSERVMSEIYAYV